jgi:hypothetical protein
VSCDFSCFFVDDADHQKQDLVLALAEVPPQKLPGVDIRGDNEAGDLPLPLELAQTALR